MLTCMSSNHFTDILGYYGYYGSVSTRIQDLMEEHEIKITELKEQLHAIEQQKMVFQYFTYLYMYQYA